VREVLSVKGSVTTRAGFGGTAPARVREQLATAREHIDEMAAFWAR